MSRLGARVRGCLGRVTPHQAHRIGEWTVTLASTVILALVGLWDLALGLLVADVVGSLLCIRRAHFVDVGRFTAGVWPRRVFESCPAFFAVGFVRHEPARRGELGKACGLQMVVGRLVFGAFTLLPRREWADFKARQKERAQ